MNYQNGVMPTNEWFEKIKAHVDFKDKTVLDCGCAEGVFCLLSLKEGAKHVTAIEEQPEMVESVKLLTKDFKNISTLHQKLEKTYTHYEVSTPLFGVVILSMIIHWMGREESKRYVSYADKAVIIFREKNPGYQIPINGKWFPTLKELTATLKGFELKHTELLMEQDNNKRIILAIYDRKKG